MSEGLFETLKMPVFTKTENGADILGLSKEKADRHNTGKKRWSLVHFKSLEPMVDVLEFGAKKYAPENWKKGLNRKEILESTQRHLAAMIDGEVIDPESNLLHSGHIQCNMQFYNYMLDNNLGGEEPNY